MFEFADKYRGTYSNGLKNFVCPFYCSYSGYEVNFVILQPLNIVSIKVGEIKLSLPAQKYVRMSFCGVLLGYTRPPRIRPTSTTFKLMDRPLGLQTSITSLVGITSMLELEFFSLRSLITCF